MGVDRSKFLLARVQHIAPGFYTEQDGGDWYIVTPDHSDRIGEGFKNRDDARRALLWLAGDPLPEGWHVEKPTRPDAIARDLECGQGYPATLWLRAIAKHFPRRL